MTIGYSRPLALWTVRTSTWAPACSPTGESPSSRAGLAPPPRRKRTTVRRVAGPAAS